MTKLKLDKSGKEVLSSVPVEVFVGDIKVDPLQKVKIDILRSFMSKLGDHGSLESEEDFDDFEIDEYSDDMNFGLTEYEYFATLVKNYDKKVEVSNGSSSESNSDSSVIENTVVDKKE